MREFSGGKLKQKGFFHSVGGVQIAECPQFDMHGLAVSLAYPSGEEGGNLFVQIISTCLPYA